MTRARPKVDRIACPWLIRRFVDPAAVFLFVAPSEVAAVAERFGATPFDIEGVFWSHRGETCTFDTMVEEFGLATEPLLRLATIVRGADTARPDLAPQAAGLLAVSLGLSRLHSDDLRQLEAGMGVYDALYLWCRDAVEEAHNWPTAKRPAAVSGAEAIASAEPVPAHPTFAEATKVWATIGFLSFGGPAGQIALMHRMLVEERKWISEARFLHALNFCMLLPGPEAQQLATYVGWLLHGTRGGLVAGTLFVHPRPRRHPRPLGALRGVPRDHLARHAVLRAEGGGARDRARSGGADRAAGAQDEPRGGRSRPSRSSPSSSSACRSR